MKHLIITIELPVDEMLGNLTKSEAQEAAKQAYRAARKALLQFTSYNEEDYTFEIEN